MKRRLSLFILISLIVALVLSLSSCELLEEILGSMDIEEEKQIPVYQGMTITKGRIASGTGYFDNDAALFADNGNNGNDNGDNGNHNGHYKGDHEDKDGELDEENPYPDNDQNENIEEEIESSLKVIGSPDTVYYANPNQDIYINIHISNPDDFEIMSFTLNGKKYSSYMFEDGSDMETIILKYNVGNASGIVEYTIDAIKYIDGTEIKDVIIDGDTTVKAGVKVDGQVTATVKDLVVDTNDIAFNVNLRDNDKLIAHSNGTAKAVLYDGEEIVDIKDIKTGNNSVTFTNLKTNTVYQYAIVASYDDLSGKGVDMHILYVDAFRTESVVLFSDINLTQESISFGFAWHESREDKTLSALKLYKDGALVSDLAVDTTEITDLLSGNTYELIAEYVNGESTESIYLEFTTAEKTAPTIEIVNVSSTQTSVSFEISETDLDEVGAITKIELVHGEDVIEAESLDLRAFADLLSGNTYKVRVTYVYNLNDGNGDRIKVIELDITTVAKVAPKFDFVDIEVDVSAISGLYSITNIDNTLLSYKVELYSEGAFVSENAEKEINFINLQYYTDYTLIITYTYNLDDGNGYQVAYIEEKVTTLPYVDIVDCMVVGNSAVSEGDITYIQATLDNPSGIKIDSVVINGMVYKVTSSSTATRLFIEIVNDGQFDVGIVELSIDKINISINNHDYAITPKTNIVNTIFVEGKIQVTKIEFVNENFERMYYALNSDVIYVLITLDNPTGYSVDSIVVSRPNRYNYTVSEIYKLNDNQYYFVPDMYMMTRGQYTLNEMSCSSNYGTKVVSCNDISTQDICYCESKIYISTPEDLMSISDYVYGMYYYELTNDIDLSGYEWHGKQFNGVLNGNGYSIKNMTFVGNAENDVKLGLFSDANGIIENLCMESVLFIAKSTSSSVSITAGAIAAYANTCVIKDCSLDSNSIIDIESGNGYVGGIVGYLSGSIVNCKNSGSVIGKSYVGGIVGYSSGHMENCQNEGSVTGEYNVGGIAGLAIGYLENCKNIGSVTGKNVVGGIVGSSCMMAVLMQCNNDGHVFGVEDVGGIIGDAYDVTVEKCINTGAVTGETKVSGIIGNASEITANGCENYGKIVGKSYVGGIVGSGFYAPISNCVNNGDILGKDSTGGIAGCIENLNVENCTNHAIVTSEENRSGGIVGIMYNAAVIHCNNFGRTNGNSCVGGIVGSVESSDTGPIIIGCTNTGAIEGKGYSIGGIVGSASYATIENCINSGDVKGVSNIGGLAGVIRVSISNSQNSGTISGVSNVGGISGHTYLTDITNCVNSGIVESESSKGGLVGDPYDPNVTNSYAFEIFNSYDEICTIDQLNSKSFYTETLGWSEDIWDFSELDVENGKYPTLKK